MNLTLSNNFLQNKFTKSNLSYSIMYISEIYLIFYSEMQSLTIFLLICKVNFKYLYMILKIFKKISVWNNILDNKER